MDEAKGMSERQTSRMTQSVYVLKTEGENTKEEKEGQGGKKYP